MRQTRPKETTIQHWTLPYWKIYVLNRKNSEHGIQFICHAFCSRSLSVHETCVYFDLKWNDWQQVKSDMMKDRNEMGACTTFVETHKPTGWFLEQHKRCLDGVHCIYRITNWVNLGKQRPKLLHWRTTCILATKKDTSKDFVSLHNLIAAFLYFTSIKHDFYF